MYMYGYVHVHDMMYMYMYGYVHAVTVYVQYRVPTIYVGISSFTFRIPAKMDQSLYKQDAFYVQKRSMKTMVKVM